MGQTFDGPNKLIILTSGTTTVDVKVLYSAWKDWVLLSNNAAFLQAFSAIGGDPLVGGQFLGSTYFLENGWKIRPQEANHTLVVSGNLYARDGSSPFVSTVGSFNVTINLSTSNLVDTVSSGSGLSSDQATQLLEIWKLFGLNPAEPLVVSETSRVVGSDIEQTISGTTTVTVTRI